MAEVLARWLKIVLDVLIGDTQCVFIAGRQITDGILAENEIIYSMFEVSSESVVVVLMLDFSKAYDCVRWEILMMVLEKLGFSRLSRRWIWACVSSASISVLVNGSPTTEFRIRRGL
ncbi:uncharacterized protein LOC120155723 [Hibiscus syriacus]|uniref:uncharacterized protein LOC120155723 n=1 Tax=Hibiscus syriacus TaxID=106335 RepID=UPI001921E3B4|nr:uncharacterized protein LOC120155723 [Hibiscus syriacus]